MSTLHVLFKVGSSDFALPASEIVEMESFSGATRVPGAEAHVAGMVRIRGKVIPVIDLRARFGLPPIERGLDARVIVVRENDRFVGLLADSAREILKIALDDFKPPPAVIADAASGFVRSVAQAGPRLVMKIDFAKVIGKDCLPKEQHHGQ